MRRCTLLIDERDQCVYYPSSGAGGQVLAMNGIPVIEVNHQSGLTVIQALQTSAHTDIGPSNVCVLH